MTDTITVDARGLSCPQPALMAQRALAGVTHGAIEVLVDSATSRDNVERLALKAGWQVAVEDQPGGGSRLVLTR